MVEGLGRLPFLTPLDGLSTNLVALSNVTWFLTNTARFMLEFYVLGFL